jgi:2-polyprenyl-6-hydroxyphenyl methylase/3-demethylubiquinone-9 3-methyltransferase
LDIACGGGLVTEPLARLGARVTGIDTSKNAIAAARAHAAGEGLEIDYRCCSLEEMVEGRGQKVEKKNLPSTFYSLSSKFDVITALEILEHVDSPAEFVKTAARLLKPGGVMIFSTINRTVKSLLLAKIAAEEILGIVPRGTHSWNQFIQPAELAEMVEGAALSVTDITGLAVNPMRAGTRMFALSKDIAINYFLTAHKSVK